MAHTYPLKEAKRQILLQGFWSLQNGNTLLLMDPNHLTKQQKGMLYAIGQVALFQ